MTAPLIVTALLGRADHAWLDGERQRHFPPERNQLPAHLTLFHQLPPDPSPLPELSKCSARRRKMRPPMIIMAIRNAHLCIPCAEPSMMRAAPNAS